LLEEGRPEKFLDKIFPLTAISEDEEMEDAMVERELIRRIALEIHRTVDRTSRRENFPTATACP
jgi:hypothetical protein